MSQIFPRLLALGTAVPPHRITQVQVLDILAQAKGKALPPRMAEILGNTGIEQRHIAMPPDYYFAERSWPDRARVYGETAADLFKMAAGLALQRAGLVAADIGQIVYVSTTGTMTPSLPSRMIAAMGFSPKTRCVPLFGYGCAGGVIGLGVAADLYRASPDKTVVRLCSAAKERQGQEDEEEEE